MSTKIKTIKGRGVVGRQVKGEAIVTKEPFMFPHGLDPRTGVVINKKHELFGRNLVGKILIFPFAVGSTSTATWLLEAIRLGKSPKALILEELDPMLAIGAILAEIFYFDKSFTVIDFPNLIGKEDSPLNIIKTGDILNISGKTGLIKII